MNIYLSNSFLMCILFSFRNLKYLKSLKLKNNLNFLAFVVCNTDLSFINQNLTLSKNLLDSIKTTDLKKIEPFKQKTSIKIIKKFYPNKILKVKEDLLISEQFSNKIVFDEKKSILLFLSLILLFLFLFTMHEITINKYILKQKLKTDFKLKQPFGNFIRIKILQKVLQDLKEAFVFNNIIYLDQINKNRERNTVSFCCKHHFLDIKKDEKVILTKDFTDFLLYAGMKGIVKKVLLYQKLEIIFFYNSQSCDSLTKQKLYKFQTSFIKESDLFSKK